MAHRSFLGVLFFASLPAGAQPCEAPSNVEAAIEAATLPTATFTGHRIAAAKKVREQFPANCFAHRFYPELFVKQGLFSQPVQEEYRGFLDAHPDHLTYLAPYPHVVRVPAHMQPSSCWTGLWNASRTMRERAGFYRLR
jgi:hypothetical protein